MGKDVATVQEAFECRLKEDQLINFSTQEKITKRVAELWEQRKPVIGTASFIPAPMSGFFPDKKDIWAVKSEKPVDLNFPYLFSPAVDDFADLVALACMGLELKEQGLQSTLVTNFVMEQRSEREIEDPEGDLHQIDGQPVKGIEMALLFGIAAFLEIGFPRGVIHTDGHSLGLEYFAGKVGLPIFTMTSMPLLFNEAIEHNLIKYRRSVVVSGDVGGVMVMNMMRELAQERGLEVEAVYGEKRAEEVFTEWGQSRINGAQVIFGDDIISSGKTLFQKVLSKAFDYGANNAVVFVPHADLVEHTLNNLNDCPLETVLVTGDTFPIRPEIKESISANNRLLRVQVFNSVMKAAEMDSRNLLTDVFNNSETQAELLRQTGLGIFPPYIARYRTVSDMLK